MKQKFDKFIRILNTSLFIAIILVFSYKVYKGKQIEKKIEYIDKQHDSINVLAHKSIMMVRAASDSFRFYRNKIDSLEQVIKK